jgi:hypothetical protein
MRGEETQILGALSLAPDLEKNSMVILPGTHSKWVSMHESRIMDFATYMTGELFCLLFSHLISKRNGSFRLTRANSWHSSPRPRRSLGRRAIDAGSRRLLMKAPRPSLFGGPIDELELPGLLPRRTFPRMPKSSIGHVGQWRKQWDTQNMTQA